jgi:hypothetical protein
MGDLDFVERADPEVGPTTVATISSAWYTPRRACQRRPHPRDLRFSAPRGGGYESFSFHAMTDLELSYDATHHVTLVAGASNSFNV